MLMIRPYFAGIIAFLATERANLNEPKRSILNSFSNCSSVMSWAGATAPVPALLISMSILPNFSRIVSTTSSIFAVSVISQRRPIAGTLYSLVISAQTSSRRFWRRQMKKGVNLFHPRYLRIRLLYVHLAFRTLLHLYMDQQ